MNRIASNLKSVLQQIPPSVKLVAVSKTKQAHEIMEAYNAGQRLFGENRVQELLQKKDLLPSDIEWHLIGHLQSNKIKYITPFISMIESVDTFRLLKAIDAEAGKIGMTTDCLLQVHIAEEETKFGFSMNEIYEMVESEEFNTLGHVRICGLMGIATFTDDTSRIRTEFRFLTSCFNELKSKYFSENPWFREISMGMSGDFLIGISEGSTVVRIGSLIFGSRK